MHIKFLFLNHFTIFFLLEKEKEREYVCVCKKKSRSSIIQEDVLFVARKCMLNNVGKEDK